jgi:hypothetical protein
MCLGSRAMDLSSHSRWFDQLVELIPAKYYLTTDEHVNLKFMKKDEREEAKARFKKQHKQAKRAKLDPEAAKTTLELQQLRGAAGSDDDSDDDDGSEGGGGSDAGEASSDGEGAQAQQPRRHQPHAGPAPGALLLPAGGAPLSREQLQEKLQRRLEAMRAERKAEEAAANAKQAKLWREGALEQGKKAAAKRPLEPPAPRSKPASAAAPRRPQQAQQAQQAQHQPPARQQQQQQPRPGGEALSFGKVDFGEEGRAGGRKGKPRASKAELLEAAERKQRETAAAVAAGGGEGKARVEREAWGSAVARAQGDKVLDDPRLLRKSLKKEGKVKKKAAAAWQGRVDKQRQDQSERQARRKGNLQARITQKKDKKKARREKKLLRAGFEGRKAGPIATPGK